MANTSSVHEADEAARAALLKAITAKVASSSTSQVLQLSEAYRNVASTPASQADYRVEDSIA